MISKRQQILKVLETPGHKNRAAIAREFGVSYNYVRNIGLWEAYADPWKDYIRDPPTSSIYDMSLALPALTHPLLIEEQPIHYSEEDDYDACDKW